MTAGRDRKLVERPLDVVRVGDVTDLDGGRIGAQVEEVTVADRAALGKNRAAEVAGRTDDDERSCRQATCFAIVTRRCRTRSW